MTIRRFSLLLPLCFFISTFCWWYSTEDVAPKSPFTITITINNASTSTVTEQVAKQIVADNTAQVRSILSYLRNNLYFTSASCLATAYLAITCRLSLLRAHLLDTTQCWSLWLSERSLEQLFDLTPAVLSKNLLTAVQERYIVQENPAHFIEPLMLFMKAVENERTSLESYRKTVTLLEKMRLGRLFFYDRDLAEKIPERLTRLAYLKSSLISSLGEYKATQNISFQNCCHSPAKDIYQPVSFWEFLRAVEYSE